MPITEKYILMCDDFRREDNGKFIIVGLYFAEMSVPQIPIVLPTLTFFCLLESDRPGNFRMSFRMRHEDAGRNLFEGMAALPVNDPLQPIVIPIKIGAIQIAAPGLYTFSLEIDGQSPIVKTFNVRLHIAGATPFGPPPIPPNVR